MPQVTDLSSEQKCPKCGGDIDKGKITGFFTYVSNRWSKQFLSSGSVPVSQAIACLHCGYLELYLDANALKQHIT